ncbi:MAG TPA: molybdenum cofactor biosynthesis protein MoaE [Thermoplasmata archaeon]|nr:molybdenum cofactor biosynthesis protein MoaE [Thermoplasmata archaeon]
MEVQLTTRPLSLAAAARALEAPGLGGVVLFAGRVRADRTARGAVEAIDYESDRALALRRLAAIAATARRRFGAERVVLWHRTGRVPADETSVIAGAACGHRAEAFAAARYLIEELKRSVPLWKTERVRSGRRPPRRRARRAGRSAG